MPFREVAIYLVYHDELKTNTHYFNQSIDTVTNLGYTIHIEHCYTAITSFPPRHSYCPSPRPSSC